MVQLTYEEMNCIRGGILVITSTDLLNTTAPAVTLDILAAAPADDKRKPRPGGGVSTS